MWITNGNVADIAIVWAQTDDGIQGFIVEKGMAGFAAQEIKHKMSLRASVTSSLFFDNVRVPDANRLPNVKGLKGPLGCLTQARYGITWGPIGAAIACLDEALNYSKERILFDRPVAATQSAQLKLADMARRITHGAVAGRAARAPEGRRHAWRRPRCRWPNGTTAAWRSTSRANVATCWAAPASPRNTARSGTR